MARCLAAGLVFCFWTRSDLWLDEALSVNIARLPLGDLRDALRHDGAPPLYYVLLHVWTGVFGTGDSRCAALSGICMVGAAVALWFVGRRIAGRPAAWIAVLLIAIAPVRDPLRHRGAHVRAGDPARLVRASSRSAVPSRRRRSAGSRCSACIVALLLYTQYWTLYLLARRGRAAHRTCRARAVRGRRARRMLVATVIGGLAFTPWLPTFLYQRAHTGTPWGEPVFPGVPLGYTLRDFAGGDVQEGWLLLVAAGRDCCCSACSVRGRRPPAHRDRPPHGARRALGSDRRRRDAGRRAHAQLRRRRRVPDRATARSSSRSSS